MLTDAKTTALLWRMNVLRKLRVRRQDTLSVQLREQGKERCQKQNELQEVQASLTLRASTSESSQNQELWTNETGQQATALAAQAWQPELNPRNPHWKKPTAENCPLASTCTSVPARSHTAHTPTTTMGLEMAYRLRVLTVLPGFLVLISSNHIRWLTTVWVSDPFFRPLQAQGTHLVYKHRFWQILIHIK